MVDSIGNSMPAPGYAKSGISTVDDELLYASNPGSYTQKGVTLKQGQGILLLGTGLQFDSASKKYVKATSAGNVEGLLRQTTDTGTDSGVTAQVFLGNILFAGTVKLSAVSAANSGFTLTSVLAGKVNARFGFFRF